MKTRILTPDGVVTMKKRPTVTRRAATMKPPKTLPGVNRGRAADEGPKENR